MDDLLARWLALREGADTASRSTELTRLIADSVRSREPVRVLDLGTGAGSNLRYLAPRLPAEQQWLVVDRSDLLLTELPARTAEWGAIHGFSVARDSKGFAVRGSQLACQVETRRLNLHQLTTLDIFEGRDLVTASALLDLVSEEWLRALASRCRAEGAAALFTITYNGQSTCAPEEPEDALVLDRFNRHQRTDKGLGGVAAGPAAVAIAERCFRDAGYQVRCEPSDWVLGPGDAELQRQLIDGWAHAATEISPADATVIAGWHLRRRHHVDAAVSRVTVGHHDLAAWLPS